MIGNIVLQIGAGGVGGVVTHKMAINRAEALQKAGLSVDSIKNYKQTESGDSQGGVFSRIILASRTIDKCKAIADSIRAKGLGEIEVDSVDADNIESIVALIEKYRPKLVVNVALPYQDLSIMEACLRTKTHYLDTANYEHPDAAHFEYKEQWAYDTRYKEAGIFALLGSGFDPGVTNVFCAYAQKHYFDSIESIDILDCNAGDHGYAFATNFNPEINLREVSSKARYWVANDTQAKISEISTESNLALNPDLKQDTIYRKFEREERHWEAEVQAKEEAKFSKQSAISHSTLKNENYCKGQWRDVAPLALMKEWDYKEVGVKNSYLLYHEELESLIRNIKGLRKIRFFMTFGESYLTHMKVLENIGFLRIDEVAHKGGKIVPIEVLKTLLPDPASLAPRTKGNTHIGCYIKGRKDGKERVIYIYNICDHEVCYKEVNAQGVSYTTGVPAMIGAKLIMEGKWGVGAKKNVAFTQSSQELEKSSIDRQQALSQSNFSAQPANLKQNPHSLDIDIESYNKQRLEMNRDMPQGGEYQGVDNGAELQENIKYWIVCCQPQYFNEQCGAKGEKIGKNGWCWFGEYEGRLQKHHSCFEEMKIGDRVLCYVSSDKENDKSEKVHAFRAVFSICNKDEEYVYLAFEYGINISPSEITQDIVDLYKGEGTYSAFTNLDWGQSGNNWFNGTFFKTTKQQFEGIVGRKNCVVQGSGVWNMEQNDPDPFMHELNLQGLPYVVCEIDSQGEVRVLEDGRR
ncbi:saccharopine dehydrogenase family protein [Helicobacter didelphidarum]|uniref:saccharopine dehydrogenase family protein n=1 Tax=Helicobacter didelphidarum TaxID=2040648 RepID=UPI001FE4CE2D|nr:saccharopine dehydrogenase family protein [Helicobacter didelphidarum]